MDPDGAVGNGSLELSTSSGNLNLSFHSGISTPIQDYLVLFIDSVPNGGFNGTASFTAYTPNGGVKSAISGYNGMGRSTAVFASGLYADYAIAISRDQIGLYTLATDSFELVGSSPVNPAMNSYSGSLDLSLMGLSATSSYFKFQSSYVSPLGGRRLESFEPLTGKSGTGNTITFTSYNEFGAPPVPEPVNVALGVFGLVACGGGMISGWRRRQARG